MFIKPSRDQNHPHSKSNKLFSILLVSAARLLQSNLLKIGMDYRDVDVGEVMEGEGEGGGLFGGDELEGIEGGELPDNIDSASSAFVKKSSSEVEGWQDGRRKSTKAIDYGLLSKNAGENDANDALFGSSGSAGSSGAGGTDSRKNSRSNSVGSTGGGKQVREGSAVEPSVLQDGSATLSR